MIKITIAALAIATATVAGSAQAQEISMAPVKSSTGASQGMVGPGLYVSNPERSLKFYTDGLGMVLRMKMGDDLIVGFGRNMMDAGIMLLQDKSKKPQKIAHAHGFDRIAWRVDDLQAINARLKAAGFSPGEIRVVHGVVQMMIVTDPDGYRMELIDSKPAPKAAKP